MVNHLILEQTCFVVCLHVGIVCMHAVWVSCNINISLPFWITEASFWTPSCHATMWMECDHPLAREPDWAKGISHRHANSTSAPVRPKWHILSAMGFSCLFLHVCTTQPWERVCCSLCLPYMQLILCGNSQAVTIDVVWLLGYRVRDSQARRSVNTAQGQEVCHHSFPDRRKRTAGLEKTMTKMIFGNQHSCPRITALYKLCHYTLRRVT